MFEEFLELLNNMSAKQKEDWVNNLKQFQRDRMILEAKKFIKYDLKFNRLTIYNKTNEVDSFLKLLGKLNQKDIEFYDKDGNKINKDLLELSKNNGK